jgi:hypothetical protein
MTLGLILHCKFTLCSRKYYCAEGTTNSCFRALRAQLYSAHENLSRKDHYCIHISLTIDYGVKLCSKPIITLGQTSTTNCTCSTHAWVQYYIIYYKLLLIKNEDESAWDLRWTLQHPIISPHWLKLISAWFWWNGIGLTKLANLAMTAFNYWVNYLTWTPSDNVFELTMHSSSTTVWWCNYAIMHSFPVPPNLLYAVCIFSL